MLFEKTGKHGGMSGSPFAYRRREMKKYLIAAGGILLAAAVVAAVGGKYMRQESVKEEKESLIYYTIGKADEDLQMVNDSLNEILSEKYGFTIDYRKLDWNIYGDKIMDAVNLHEDFDVAFASSVQQGDYVGNARSGAWYPLDNFLAGEGKELYDSIPEVLWEGARIDGHIYGVPTSKELAVVNQWMYPKELIEKYEIDLDRITCLEDLEPVFAMIKEKEPEYTVMELNQYSHFFEVYGYEYLLDYQIPLMVKSDDENVELVNILETECGEQTLRTLRKYYLAEYINQDAPIREGQTLQKGEKVFLRQAQGGPYAEVEWSNQRGYEVVGKVMTPVVVNTESVRGAYMCVSSSSDHPEEACRFLQAVNTDSEVRNMLQYGIEGEHYTLNQEGQVIIQKDTYAGVTYTQGNYFLLNTRVGQPVNLWDQYKKFNDSAVPSPTLCFEMDLSGIEEEIQAVRKVSEKFYPALMTGSVDVDEYLPMYRKELRDAGIETIRKELQRQLRQWKKDEKAKK